MLLLLATFDRINVVAAAALLSATENRCDGVVMSNRRSGGPAIHRCDHGVDADGPSAPPISYQVTPDTCTDPKPPYRHVSLDTMLARKSCDDKEKCNIESSIGSKDVIFH